MKNKSPFFQRTIKVIKNIPKGKILTYARVSHIIGAPGCARQVSYVLSSSSKKYNLPWHRVINSQGKISLTKDRGGVIQKSKLENEGIIFQKNKVDLKIYLWEPKLKEIQKLLKGIPEHISLYKEKI